MKFWLVLIPALLSLTASYAQDENFRLKPLLRIQSRDPILVDNGWQTVSDRIQASIRVATDTDAQSVYVKAYFYDTQNHVVHIYKQPCPIFTRVGRVGGEVGLPAILKRGEEVNVYFALTPALKDKKWTSVVVVFGNDNEAVARSKPPAAFPNLEFPEKGLIKDPVSDAPPESVRSTTPSPVATPEPAADPSPPANASTQEEPQETATLLAPLRIELKHNGKLAGTTTLQTEASLPIVKRDGTEALVRHIGGESWIRAASEWDIIPITDIKADLDQVIGLSNSIQASIVISDDGEPCIAWITARGLFYGKRKGSQWEIEKIDNFDKSAVKGLAPVTCRLRLVNGGNPCIAYAADYTVNTGNSFSGNTLLKVATWETHGWKLQILQHDISHAPGPRLNIGEWNKSLTVIKSGIWPPILWILQNGAWEQRILHGDDVPSSPKDGSIFRGTTFELLGSAYFHKEGADDADFWAQLSSFDGTKWTRQKIQSPQKQVVIAHFLATHDDNIYASFFTASNNRLNLARRTGASWRVMSLNPEVLLDAPSENSPNREYPLLGGARRANLGRDDLFLAGMDATIANKAGLLMAIKTGDAPEQHAIHFGDVTFPQRCLSEKVVDGFPCDFTFDKEGTPHVVFVSGEGKLCLATRTHSPQFTTDRAPGEILHIPMAGQTLHEAIIRPLPEASYPGSEQDRQRRISALGKAREYSIPVAGKAARLMRWGSGEKAIVFFAPPLKWTKLDGSEYREVYDNTRAASIAAQIDAYIPMIKSGYSVITWEYPEDADERAENIDEVLLHPNLLGVARDVVEGLREKTGLTDLILVGNGSSSELLLWDLTALEKDEKSKVILISPDLYILPNLSKLPPKTSAIVIDNPSPGGSKPEVADWIKSNRSKATDTLAPDGVSPDLGTHISHDAFARWLEESFIKADDGG